MPNANNLPSLAPSEPQKPASEIKKSRRIESSGDLRTFLANIAMAVAQGDMEVDDAAVAIKACEQINMSLYSEIKSAALQASAGKVAPALGALPLGRSDQQIPKPIIEHKAKP